MGKEFPLEPVRVPKVNTRYRRIQTMFPVPESVPIIERMRASEPISMGGQPPVVWDTGKAFCVSDRWGNMWLDFSSGVLVTATGHGQQKVIDAVCGQANTGVLHSYCFPTEARSKLVTKLSELPPDPLEKVFLLTTGSEAVECCIKLARTYGMRNHGPEKNVLVSFDHSFHGRTLGSQQAGGIPGLKDWIGEPDPRFQQVPYPDGFRNEDRSFDGFLQALEEKGIDPKTVCGVLSETYPGVDVSMWTPEYARAMRQWCTSNGALLILDEVQAGFGRTGKWFGFEHLGITPDLIACGKGISGGMPLSAVIGSEDVMDLYGPGAMTSTHSANPVCSAATLANLTLIEELDLVENAANLEPVLLRGLETIMKASNGHVGCVNGRGLAAAIQFVRPGTTEPDPDIAWQVVKACVESGLLLFAPVGVGGGAVKVCPPLIITREALEEGLGVILEIVKRLS